MTRVKHISGSQLVYDTLKAVQPEVATWCDGDGLNGFGSCVRSERNGRVADSECLCGRVLAETCVHQVLCCSGDRHERATFFGDENEELAGYVQGAKHNEV